jgi:hypothetical protein
VVPVDEQLLPPIRRVSIISCNSHESFTAAVGCVLQGLTAVQELQLLDCDLSDGLPTSLVRMRGLTDLSCARCQLRHLPGGEYLAGGGHIGGRLVKAGPTTDITAQICLLRAELTELDIPTIDWSVCPLPLWLPPSCAR